MRKSDILYEKDEKQANYVYKIFFECQITGGTATTSTETDDMAFFTRANLPPLSLARVLPAQIQRLFELHDQSTAAADFD